MSFPGEDMVYLVLAWSWGVKCTPIVCCLYLYLVLVFSVVNEFAGRRLLGLRRGLGINEYPGYKCRNGGSMYPRRVRLISLSVSSERAMKLRSLNSCPMIVTMYPGYNFVSLFDGGFLYEWSAVWGPSISLCVCSWEEQVFSFVVGSFSRVVRGFDL